MFLSRVRTIATEAAADLRPTDDGRPTRIELAAAAAAVLCLTLALYLPYALDAGLFTDDYAYLSQAKTQPFELKDEVVNHIDAGYRMLGGLTQRVQSELFLDKRPGILLPALLNTFLGGFALYLVARLARLRRFWAGAITALFVTLPWIDATRLWAAANFHAIGLELWLFGLAAALWGLRSDVPAQRVWRHGLAALLYAAAILTSEGFWAPVCASAVVYLCVGPWRSALRRCAIDVAVASLALAPQIGHARQRGSDTSPGAMLDRAGDMLEAWVQLIRFTLPADRVLWGPAGFVVLLAVIAGLTFARERKDEIARALPDWGVVAAVGFVLAMAGLAVYLPTIPSFTPELEGTNNRFAVHAAVGSVVMLIGLAGVVALGLASLANRPRAAMPLAWGAAVLVVLGAIQLEHNAQSAWNDGRDKQEAILKTVEQTLGGAVPRGASIATVRHENFTAHGVPVFTTSWDLLGALFFRTGDSTTRGHPFQLPMKCGPTALKFADGGGPSRRANTLPYRRLFMVDIPTATAARVDSRRTCIDVVDDLAAGRPPVVGK